MAYANGYVYRKLIPITGSSGAETNYQVKLIVNSGIGSDTPGVIYLNNNCNDFPYPITFFASNDTTELSYWRENSNTFWIKISDNLSSDQSFYIYYGRNNPSIDPVGSNTNSWTRYTSNPILTVGTTGQWDDFWIAIHSIVKNGSTYYAYYNGHRSTTQSKIGLATSTDGIIWTKDGGNPVFDVGSSGAWDDYAVGVPCVWIEDSTWYMLYGGSKSDNIIRIGLATSTDGITWTKNGSNPVLNISSGGAWDEGAVLPGTKIFKESSTYYLYYWGWSAGGSSIYSTWKIGLATSTDLINWTKDAGNPLLSGGGTDAWNAGVLEPCVVKIGSIYYMWYQGNASPGDFSAIGLATSTDKITWSKVITNPVLDNNSSGFWDSNWTEAPIVLDDFHGSWKLYFSGSKGSADSPRMQQGIAISPDLSNGINTFLFFDDFDSGIMSAANWYHWLNNGSSSINSGILETVGHASYNAWGCKQQFGTNTAYRGLVKVSQDTSAGDVNFFGFDDRSVNGSFIGTGVDNVKNVAGSSKLYVTTREGIATSTVRSETVTAYYIAEIQRNSNTNVKFLANDSLKATITTNVPLDNAGFIQWNNEPTLTIFWDWVLVRKFVATEPLIGTAGSQQQFGLIQNQMIIIM